SVSVMKKALQIRHLRAEVSVSDGAVVRRASKGRFYRFRDRFAQGGIRNVLGEQRRLSLLLRRSLGAQWWRRGGGRRRQRPRHEAQPWPAWQTDRDLGRPLGQLEAPDRVADVHDERPVGLRPRRPGVAPNPLGP